MEGSLCVRPGTQGAGTGVRVCWYLRVAGSYGKWAPYSPPRFGPVPTVLESCAIPTLCTLWFSELCQELEIQPLLLEVTSDRETYPNQHLPDQLSVLGVPCRVLEGSGKASPRELHVYPEGRRETEARSRAGCANVLRWMELEGRRSQVEAGVGGRRPTPSALQPHASLCHREQPRGDPGPRGGAAAEEALHRLQQVVPARGQHLGCGSRPLRAVHRAAH